MVDLSVSFAGMDFPNPFMLASAPPARNGEMIKRAFAAGWGGAVTKSIALEPMVDLKPRLAPLKHHNRNTGMQNIELSTQLTLKQWQEEIASVKSEFPGRPLWASIMDSPDKKHWQKLALAMEDAGADALELNVSCPHGMPSKGMGAFIGQDPELTGQVVSWVKEVSRIPVIVKLTPNVTDIALIALAAKEKGADGFCTINSLSGITGVDLEALSPVPNVGSYSTYGGFTGPSIKPVALRCTAQTVAATGLPVSGVGGISNWEDAAEFIALGAGTVQLCTSVMWKGFGMIDRLLRGLEEYLIRKGFDRLNDLKGAALSKMVTFPEMPGAYGAVAEINSNCNLCGSCVTACGDGAFQAISPGENAAVVNSEKCDGCGLCRMVCPAGNIEMKTFNEV